MLGITRPQMLKMKKLLDAGWEVDSALPFKPGETATFRGPEGQLVKVGGDGSLIAIEPKGTR